MASYSYLVTVNGEMVQRTADGAPIPWNHASATAYAHHANAGGILAAGTEIKIERRIRCTLSHDHSAHRCNATVRHWLAHRRYIVGEDGIVRRRDR
jgi:hypothetical protein